jgi:hypothetical protein
VDTAKLPSLIALYSSSMQSGKSEVARILRREYGYTLVKFADPLKDMTRVLLAHMGMYPNQIEKYIEGDRKEETIEFGRCQTTARRIMQTLGSEWGRDTIGKDLWVSLAQVKINELIGRGQRVVIDDMRFPNEYEMIRQNEGRIIRVERRGNIRRSALTDHQSEGQLDTFKFDATIFNNGSLADLHRYVIEALGVKPTAKKEKAPCPECGSTFKHWMSCSEYTGHF